MKKLNTIKKNIERDLKLSTIEKHGSSEVDSFIRNAKRYIKAIKQGRALCSIGSVSKSGMSRTLKFVECSGNIKNGFYYLNFYQLFVQLGFRCVSNTSYFRVNGCGMDMVFATNYDIIHSLYRLGFLSKKECEILAQKTPTII